MAFAGAMLFVKDLSRMEAFYRDVLGLTPIEDSRHPDWVEFEAAGARFSLHAIPHKIAKDIEITSPPDPRETDPGKLFFTVSDLAAARARLETLGLPILERPWGGWETTDPEGNILGLSAG